MLKKRIIPVVQFSGMNAIVGRQFNPWRTIGSVAAQVAVYEARGVDELMLLDVGATPTIRGPNFDLLRSILRGALMPITVGGGMLTVGDLVKVIRDCGADKVAIGAGLEGENGIRIGLIDAAAQRLGRQAISAIVNHVGMQVWRWREGKPRELEMWRWRSRRPAGIADTAIMLEMYGAGEIILNSVDRDGMMQGYDLAAIERVSRAVSIPVVALGGAGTYEHMYQAFEAGAHAVAAGAMFAFSEARPLAAAEFLASRGVPVRVGP